MMQKVLLKRQIGHVNGAKNKYNLTLIIGITFLLCFLLTMIIYPLVGSYDQFQMVPADRLKPPSAVYFLGTDDYGRDLLTRICKGTQLSLMIGFSVAIVSSLLGTLMGILASYIKAFDQFLMRLCDGITAIPGILLAMAMMAMLGSSMINLFIALTIIFTPKIARIVRSEALVIVNQTYIEALKITGVSSLRIIIFHLIPNVSSLLLVQFTLVFAEAILSEASLSFLGIGVAAPYASLGNILEVGKKVYTKAWWIIVFAGMALIFCVWGLGLISEGLNKQLNPKLKK